MCTSKSSLLLFLIPLFLLIIIFIHLHSFSLHKGFEVVTISCHALSLNYNTHSWGFFHHFYTRNFQTTPLTLIFFLHTTTICPTLSTDTSIQHILNLRWYFHPGLPKIFQILALKVPCPGNSVNLIKLGQKFTVTKMNSSMSIPNPVLLLMSWCSP